MVEIEVPLICPKCKNNMCLLYPDIFAKEHLYGASKKWYESKKKDLDDFLLLKMAEYGRTI